MEARLLIPIQILSVGLSNSRRNSMQCRLVYQWAVLTLMATTWAFADGGADHQKAQPFPIKLGTSGGNVNDSSRLFCCSGTLGSLVTKNGMQYILSNNHVLARSNQASPGEDISQPGLIDNNCRIPPIVADFTETPSLGAKNVDAAIALVRSGAVDPTGYILDIGPLSPDAQPASIGLSVKKSGRTTGLTTGTIGSINTDVNVQYQSGCGKGKKFTIFYRNQVVIKGSGFSAGGDSGSLIVTNADSNPQPVGLLFAGSSTSTIGNPIQDVINALGISFSTTSSTGSTGSANLSASISIEGPAASELDYAKTVKERHKKELFALEPVLGIGVGQDDDNPSEAVIVVYLETGRPLPQRLSRRLDGLKVKVVTTERFVAYGNEKWGDNTSSAK